MTTLLKVAILEDNKIQLKDRIQNIEENRLADIVFWSTNSTEFFDKLDSAQPDALILDIDLGADNMTGLEVAFKLKLPVLFVSGYNAKNLKEIEELKREYEFPVEHITKPFTDSDFIKTTERFLKDVKNQIKSEFVFIDFKGSKRNRILIDSIVCLESETGNSGASNNKCIYFIDRKPETIFDFSFTKMEDLGFAKNTFIQTHKSYRVNAKKIKRYNKNHTVDVEVMNKAGNIELKSIPVSDNYQSLLRQYR